MSTDDPTPDAADAPAEAAAEAAARDAARVVEGVPGERGDLPVVVPQTVVLPPPPPGVRHVRVVRIGVVVADDDVRERVEHFFRVPMMVLALLILPLLVLELFWINRHPELVGTWIDYLVMVGFGVIWLAFLVEFVVKVAIAEHRVEYLRRNWLDVVIIAAPLLRPIRLFKVARTAKIFTLRGVGMKTLRYGLTVILGLEVADKVAERFGLRRADGRPDPRRMTRAKLIDEVRELRTRVDGWEAWHEAHREHRRLHGRDDWFDHRDRPGEDARDPGESGPRST